MLQEPTGGQVLHVSIRQIQEQFISHCDFSKFNFWVVFFQTFFFQVAISIRNFIMPNVSVLVGIGPDCLDLKELILWSLHFVHINFCRTALALGYVEETICLYYCWWIREILCAFDVLYRSGLWA